MLLERICPAQNSLYFFHTAGVSTPEFGPKELISIRSLKEYEGRNDFIRFNFCPFCGEELPKVKEE